MTDPLPTSACPDCGAPLPPESPQSLCPACLMRQALASRTVARDGDKAPHLPPPSPEEIADRFPGYEILECLGRGGMGAVYKARQKSLNRLVAIKILAPERVGERCFAERFTIEAELLAKLGHPHIVTIHDFGETGGLFYLVMEFIDGVNLRDLLRDGKLEAQQALAIVPPICDALQYAHDKGIVHRDIKPENILLDRDGRVKIADFGIASLVGASGENSGTPPYMAPEQSGGTVDRRADIYALGVVLYEMLTGERPEKDPVAPSKRVEVSVKIDEMVLRALEKEPERRYQTAGEFRTMVETIAATPSKPARVETRLAGENRQAESTVAAEKSKSPLRGIVYHSLVIGVAYFMLCWSIYESGRELASLGSHRGIGLSSATQHFVEFSQSPLLWILLLFALGLAGTLLWVGGRSRGRRGLWIAALICGVPVFGAGIVVALAVMIYGGPAVFSTSLVWASLWLGAAWLLAGYLSLRRAQSRTSKIAWCALGLLLAVVLIVLLALLSIPLRNPVFLFVLGLGSVCGLGSLICGLISRRTRLGRGVVLAWGTAAVLGMAATQMILSVDMTSHRRLRLAAAERVEMMGNRDSPTASVETLERENRFGATRLEWQVKPDRATCSTAGWYAVEGDRLVAYQDMGNPVEASAAPFKLVLEHHKQNQQLKLSIGYGGGTGVSGTREAPGSNFQSGSMTNPTTLAADRYTELWRGECFDQDSEGRRTVLRTYVFVARLLGPDEDSRVSQFGEDVRSGRLAEQLGLGRERRTDSVEELADAGVGRLEFRIAPKATDLDDSELASCMGWLKDGKIGFWWKDGRLPGISGQFPQNAWIPVSEFFRAADGLVVNEYEGIKYLLVSDRPAEVMNAMSPRGGEKDRRGVMRVSPTRDESWQPAVGFELNERGGEQLAALTQANLYRSLAFVIDGKVVSAPVIKSAMGKSGMITGKFSEQEVDDMVKTIRGGFTHGEGNPPISRLIISKERRGQVSPDGMTYSLDGEVVAMEKLQERFQQMVKEHPELQVIVYGNDPELPAGRAIAALQTARAAGVKHVRVSTGEALGEEPADAERGADGEVTELKIKQPDGSEEVGSLRAEGIDLLREVLSREPDHVVPADRGAPLVPPILLEWEGNKYAVQSDKIVLIGAKDWTMWLSPGIDEKLIEHSDVRVIQGTVAIGSSNIRYHSISKIIAGAVGFLLLTVLGFLMHRRINRDRRLEITALFLCVAGVIMPLLILIGHLFGIDQAIVALVAYVLFAVMQLAALILGIIRFSEPLGRAAAIASGVMLLGSILFLS